MMILVWPKVTNKVKEKSEEIVSSQNEEGESNSDEHTFQL